MRIVMLDRASLDREDLAFSQLAALASDWHSYPQTTPEQRLAHCEGAEVVISNKVVLDQPLLAQLPALRLICVAATGVNNIDLEAADALGIKVANARDYAANAVAQHTFALLLGLTNQCARYQQAIAQGTWSASEYFCLLDYPMMELSGKTLGIIGYGNLGQAVAKLAQAFGMSLLIAARDAEDTRSGRVPLAQLLAESDVVSLHCPLTAENQHMMGAAEFAQMKTSALLINTARGGLVDEAALISALTQGEIAGAALDVVSQEPPPAHLPIINTNLPNLLLTPHNAWGSRECRQRLLDEVVANIVAYQSGQARNYIRG